MSPPEQPVEVSFFVPCFNESANIVGALDSIKEVMERKKISYEVIVVDDGSTDNTSSVVQAYRASNGVANMTFHRNTENKGLGFNYVYWAKRARGQYYMLVNGDNDVSPADLSRILDLRGKADIIIPYVENQEERPLFRRVVSKIFTFLVNLLGGNSLRYYNGLVLHLRTNVERFQPKTIGFAYQAELLCQALTHGCSYTEVPFHSITRRGHRTSAFRLVNIVSVTQSLSRIAVSRLSAAFSGNRSRKA